MRIGQMLQMRNGLLGLALRVEGLGGMMRRVLSIAGSEG